MSTIFPRLDPHLILTSKIEAPTVVNAIEAIKQELVLKLTQTGIGNRLQGEVIAKLPDGSFIAKIADLPVHVELPRNPAIGQKISLSISQILPHPVFTLHQTDQAASLVSVKSVAGKPETPFHDYIRQLSVERQSPPQQTEQHEEHNTNTASANNNKSVNNSKNIISNVPIRDAKSATVTTMAAVTPEAELSPAARLISQVLKEQSGSQALAQIRAPKALLTLQQLALSPAQMSAQFAQEIRQNLQSSGLFYESHIADWLNNKRGIAELKQEPQAQLPIAPATADETVLQHLTKDQHEQLSQLVNQQLNLLDQQRLQYQGWLTPNIAFHWDLEAQEQASPHSATSQDESEKIWNSKLEVNLPELGKVSIMLTLRRNKLELNLQGNRVDTINRLNASFPELASQMHASGTDIVSYNSAYHELP